MKVEQTLNSAIAQQRAGLLREAARQYQLVLAIQPAHWVANHNLGAILADAGQPQRALPYLERAVHSAPTRVECWRSLARCRYAEGLWEEAMAAIEQAERVGLADAHLAQLRARIAGKPGGRKIVCVGRNKTGTTSIEAALRSLGYTSGLQARGEMLMRDWARRDFTRIVALCRTADAFQDVPFSEAYTLQAIDTSFPGSKFILTIRDSPEQWFESLVRFHTKIVGKGRRPTPDDLRQFEYRYKGYLWEAFTLAFGDDERLLYDKDVFVASYLDHNRCVTAYFRHRPDDLLVLNVADGGAMQQLCEFLNTPYQGQVMPHLNRSR